MKLTFPTSWTRLGLGAALFGSAYDERLSFAQLDRFLELGGNWADTAHIYAAWLPDGWGASERLLGRWMRARGVGRGASAHGALPFGIGTKGGHMPLDDLENHRVRPECIRQDLHESLDRLGVDAVECYWLHRDDPTVPVGELIDVLHEVVQAGLVGAYGCSNWTPPRMAEADAWAAAHGRDTFGAHQVGFSLGRANQNGPMGMLYMDGEMADWHRATARPVFAYSPQAVGFFGGKHTPATGEEVDPATWRAGNPVAEKCRPCYYSTENFARLARAEDLARRRGVSPNQIALAWLLAQEFPVYPIIGPRSLVQLEDAWAAQEITLTPVERDWLARA